MFFDTNSPQTNNQNVNVSNPISIGSWGADASGFAPTNETKAEFTASNDLGASVGVGIGGTASAGAVGMSKESTPSSIRDSTPSFDGYFPKSNSTIPQNIYTYVAIAGASLIALIALLKSK